VGRKAEHPVGRTVCTEATIQDFGEEIAELVYWLTDAEQGGRRMRKMMSAWRLGSAPWEAKMIKLAELIDNTKEICRWDRDLRPFTFGKSARSWPRWWKPKATGLPRS
jgi:hypothetical protein